MKDKDKYLNKQMIENVTVVYSHLDEPDAKFGAPKHSVTVAIGEEWVNDLRSTSGVTTINGLKQDDDGNWTIKLSSKKAIKRGLSRFPRVDADKQPSDDTVWSRDTVSVRVQPVVLSLNGSLSCYLEGVMLIEKAERDGGSAADAEWGFDGSAPTVETGFEEEDVPAETDDSIPF